MTLSRLWSRLTSTTSPEKSLSGPDVTRTTSPTVNSAFSLGRSTEAVCMMRSTSARESATGLFWAPTKPVTPGVFLTSDHVSSVSSICTST
jgi:hypothetical protein